MMVQKNQIRPVYFDPINKGQIMGTMRMEEKIDEFCESLELWWAEYITQPGVLHKILIEKEP